MGVKRTSKGTLYWEVNHEKQVEVTGAYYQHCQPPALRQHIQHHEPQATVKDDPMHGLK